jgi:hypothetical protein
MERTGKYYLILGKSTAHLEVKVFILERHHDII